MPIDNSETLDLELMTSDSFLDSVDDYDLDTDFLDTQSLDGEDYEDGQFGMDPLDGDE